MKPDDTTWYEYIYSDEFTNEERRELRAEFFELMADEARDILEESSLDEARYEIDVVNRTQIEANDDWLMDEQEEAEELRDVLAGHGIGDESVGVFVTPRSSEGEIADLPPDHVPVDEYTVYVEMQRVQASLEGAKDRLNETMAEAMDEE